MSCVVRQIIALLLLTASMSAAADLVRHDFSGSGMSTTFRIACYAESKEAAAKAVDACLERVAYLNAIFTDYDPASELMKLCSPEAAYPRKVSRELFDLLQRSRELAEKTEGAFDPTCGHVTHLWRRAKRLKKLPPADRLAQAVAATDWRRITLHPETQSVTLTPGTLIDLGGIAKGYAADECLRVLKQHGITRAVVLAGGDTSAGDPPPNEEGWEVTLRTDSQHESSIRLANRCVSTSGDLYQFTEIEGVRYSHIVSPKTGLGLRERVACSVSAPDCTTSDALATAMCVLGKTKGAEVAARIPGVELRFPE
ncbi:FAD:protein FMN transferase [Brevifollis gellanilyticus]|uniref:FAD:protein FMN transferase n=1 Tax=Brevifollis gellanilyticus TaxID=748831 RepID=A0A512MFS3_9BACT|nr:FAD:protein FMN transferase [Brevifollis gellanilyticus]GEP45593.1 thiamine biosynthesis lipoprotein ApbE [Brevifollis gellanilyticus]